MFDQSRWGDVLAELVFDTLSVFIWIEEGAKDSLLFPEELSAIVSKMGRYLFEQSGAYSVDESQGILAIMSNYFGSPPNIDGDGKLDILLLDIRDSFELTGSFVAGFFDPNDLTNSPTSNKRDLIYLDLYPTIKYDGNVTVEKAVATLVHEYQHLIHANYEGPEREYIFINEGLSEMAEILCGFPPRPADRYLLNSTRPLLSWNSDDPLRDYSRASLWTHFLFEQIGFENIKYLVQSNRVGLDDYEQLLYHHSYFTFETVFTNWGMANLVNDASLGSSYGYRHPLRQGVRLIPVARHARLPGTETVSLPNLAVAVLEVPLVRDLHFRMAPFSPAGNVHMMASYPNGERKIFQDQPSSFDAALTDHDYASALVLLENNTHPQDEEDDGYEEMDYLVAGEKSGIAKVLSYDDGSADVFINQASYLLIGKDGAIAVRFNPKEEVWLESISTNAVFLSEIQGSGIDPAESRDVIVEIRSEDGGIPGALLAAPEHHIFSRSPGNLKSETISLWDNYRDLSQAIKPFFVVIRNDGDDENYFAIGMDSSPSVSATRFYGNAEGGASFSWHGLDELPVGGNTLAGFNAIVRANVVAVPRYANKPVVDTDIAYDFGGVTVELRPPFQLDSTSSGVVAVLPSGIPHPGDVEVRQDLVRARFPLEIDGDYTFFIHLLDQQSMDAIETRITWRVPVPRGFMAGQNYPNPFNNQTNIPIVVLERGTVQVRLFNLLGQEVLSIEARRFSPGTYSIPLDPGEAASGVYIARIKNSRERDRREVIETVKMTLMK